MRSLVDSKTIRVLVADDYEVVRAGLCTMLSQLEKLDVIAEAADGPTAVQLAQSMKPDLIILNVALPLLSGIEATREILATLPQVQIIICSSDHKENLIEEAMRAGACGYLLTRSARTDLPVAIEAVMRGEIYLSPKAVEVILKKYLRQRPDSPGTPLGLSEQERRVLQLLAEGKNNRQISVSIRKSVRTVEGYRTQLMDKLNMRTVAELTKYAIREGITQLD